MAEKKTTDKKASDKKLTEKKATVKKTADKKPTIKLSEPVDKKQLILDKYMDYVLTHGEQPKSVHAFTKSLEMNETEFYTFFNTFDRIDSEIFQGFYENTMQQLVADDMYLQGNAKYKLLTFYFVLFEQLTENRSFVLSALTKDMNKLKSLGKLKDFKKYFTKFISSLEFDKIDLKVEKVNDLVEKSMEQVFYGQFLFLLNFWMNDTSSGFEKTDVLIEKTVLAGFDMIQTKPLESILDLGKFLWKEISFKK